MGGKSSPAPPDYRGAALEQAQASKEVTNIQNYANRPVINTPFGSQSWETRAITDPATGQEVTQWTQNTQLAPQLQAALDSQMAVQQGRSDLAQGFMQNVANSYQNPFDWQNLPDRVMPNAPTQLQGNIADYAQGLQTGVDPMTSGLTTGFDRNPMYGGVNSRSDGLNYRVDNNNQFLSGGVSPQQLQMGLDNSGLQDIPRYDMGARDQIANQLMERMQPTHDRQLQGLQAQLSNQGFQIGSEAYNRAMGDLMGAQSRERFNALDQAGTEAQRMYNMGMGARQQGFNERQAMGNFANSAANQAFNQSLGAEQFRNQTAGQGFNQNLQALNFGNQAMQQGFNQDLSAAQFGNQAQQQDFSQLMALAGLNNQTMGQAYNQNLGAAQFGNQALGQAAGLDINRMNAMNQAAGQAFNFGSQYADQMARQRQQAIAEEQLRRAMPLNEMNALLTGQQVGMPQMPSFSQAQRSETPQLLNATNMGYQAQLAQSNAQNAGMDNLLGAATSLGGAAMPFMFSDARLKTDIRKIGEVAAGISLYRYRWVGSKIESEGVLAQEVQQVRPDLVRKHASGYLQVNYGGL